MSTEQQRWRVAMIGAGTIVQRGHIPNFQRLDNAEVVAVCDVNTARAAEVASEAGVGAVFGDYQEMLREIKPDITVVATPNIFHKPMSLAALEAGSHVLCEKPLALTYQDAKEMMTVAQAAGRSLTVGTHYRYSDPMQLCKQHVDAGFFGPVYAARTVWHRRSGIPGFGSWFTNKDLAGGGAILDIGIHALDRALYLMGYPKPVTASGALFAELGSRALGLGGWGADITERPTAGTRFDVDDLAWALVRFDNGAVLQFQVAWATHFPEHFQTEIYGADGGALIGNRDQIELYRILNGQPVSIQAPLPSRPGNSYARLVENWVRHLDGDPTAEVIPTDHALIAVSIIDAIMRSAQSGREVEIKE